MGDNNLITNPNYPTSFSLPPGCRFYPSDEQLVCHYLTSKNTAVADHYSSGFDVIKEIDFYGYEPFNLPDVSCFPYGRGGRKRHYYCFVARVLVGGGGGARRRAGGGYWKRKGMVRDVLGGGCGGKVVVGTRKSFVFYIGDRKTDWFMYEYALIDNQVASFVLCRVFIKSCRRGINSSEHALSSCGEASVATLRHIGVRYDGSLTSVIGDAKGLQENHLDDEKQVLSLPMGRASELADRVASVPISEQRKTAMIADALTAQQLVTILEEDFIELDDLLCPLPGIDFS